MAVAWSESWHRGVLGIAAGRLARELHRPTLLLALGEGSATGSGRSIPGIALHDFLDAWRGDLARFGGHDQAVGLTVALDDEPGRLERLREAWETAAAQWPGELLVRRHEYELALAPRRVTPRLLANLARLEPHGQGNPQPLARVGPLTLAAPPRIFGKRAKHLSALALGADGGRVGLVGWRWGDHPERLGAPGERFEVLGHLEMDRYRNRPAIRLVDARPLPPA